MSSPELIDNVRYCSSCKKYGVLERDTIDEQCMYCGYITIKFAPPLSSKPMMIPPPRNVPMRPNTPRLTPAGTVSIEASPSAWVAQQEEEEFARASQESMEDAPEPEPRPASPKLLDGMHKFPYIPLGETPTTCAVCMDDFNSGDKLVKTACCGNITHHTCMENTLCVIPHCPFCRSKK